MTASDLIKILKTVHGDTPILLQGDGVFCRHWLQASDARVELHRIADPSHYPDPLPRFKPDRAVIAVVIE